MQLSFISCLFVFRYNNPNNVNTSSSHLKIDGYDYRFPLTHKESNYNFREQLNKKNLLDKLKSNETNVYEKLKYLEQPNTPKSANLTNGGLINEWTPWEMSESEWEY